VPRSRGRRGVTAHNEHQVTGFTDITITPTHQVTDGMHSAIIRASKPTADVCCGVNACCTPAEQAVDPTATVVEAKTASGCGCVS
jgi:arsenite methyltransferase